MLTLNFPEMAQKSYAHPFAVVGDMLYLSLSKKYCINYDRKYPIEVLKSALQYYFMIKFYNS